MLIEQTLDRNNSCLLDLCSGTGSVAYKYLLREKERTRVILLDFSPSMLIASRKRAERLGLIEKHEIQWLLADAQQIPLLDESVDRVTLAYGIRNIPNPHQCLKEIYRVLTPKGRLGILELTRPKQPWLHRCHQLYLKTAIPLLGYITGHREAYKHLSNSVASFAEPIQLLERCHRVGSFTTNMIPLSMGIAHLIIADKCP